MSAKVQRSDNLVHTEVNGEVVMMSLEAGNYYGLEHVGARIWASLEEPVRVEDLCASLEREFEVTPETCRQQVSTFLQALLQHQLIRILPA